jgi:RNA polymerase sigma-70 factor (ECF subfamily)
LESPEITLLLRDLQNGKADALSELIPMVYKELRRLAAYHLRQEKPGHTLQATALVHEAYLKLVGVHLDWQSRAHFFGIASRLMRQILVEYARKRSAAKRGGLVEKVPLDEALVVAPDRASEFLALDEALKRLEALDARQSRVVELRYFGGLSIEESAEVLGIAPRTVKRDWEFARAWLHREIGRGRPR